MNATTQYKEEFKQIQGFRNYEISNLGRVRNSDTGQFRKLSTHKAGYLIVNLSRHSERYMRYVHRLVAEHFIANPENLPEVNHLDGDKKNPAFWNLRWDTRLTNNQHAIDNGLNLNGFEVYDTATGATYRSIHEAARATGWAHRTLNRWLVEGRNNRSSMVLVGLTDAV